MRPHERASDGVCLAGAGKGLLLVARPTPRIASACDEPTRTLDATVSNVSAVSFSVAPKGFRARRKTFDAPVSNVFVRRRACDTTAAIDDQRTRNGMAQGRPHHRQQLRRSDRRRHPVVVPVRDQSHADHPRREAHRRFGADRHQMVAQLRYPGLGQSRRRSGPRPSCRSTCRRSSAWARPGVSNTSLRVSRGQIQPPWEASFRGS